MSVFGDCAAEYSTSTGLPYQHLFFHFQPRMLPLAPQHYKKNIKDAIVALKTLWKQE